MIIDLTRTYLEPTDIFKEPNLWNFNPDLVFDIFDKFYLRVQLIKKIMETYTEFIKLEKEFLQDYNVFRENISDLDHRLSTIICQAFDDCSGLDSCFRLIETLGNLLERPLIKKTFDKKYANIVHLMQEEVKMVRKMYDEQMLHQKIHGRIQMHKFMPKVSGSLKWAEEMRIRISNFVEDFKHLEHK
ncbi:DNAH [Acanthosepion pharaonis]|uniref:DNAH n=1 Tax=Acanthosepion pharaonis TaxID=158019 RepID=A0A812EF84_ACAPH|nr:DNAH [Sepia pharaonis]